MMKTVILITGLILFITNLLFSSIIHVYPIFNVGLNCGVIVVTTLLLYIVNHIRLKDGFRTSLFMLFCIFGLVEFILGLIAPQHYKGNWYLIVIIFIVAVESIILVITNIVSKKI
jgi:tellurite resistance protein TehA-like permease